MGIKRPRPCGSFLVLCVQCVWIHVGVSGQTEGLNSSYVGDKNSSTAELVLDCNAVQSAAGYGLAWLSLKNDLPPNSVVKYTGVGVSEGISNIPQCSLSSPDLCNWVLTGTTTEWTVTSSLYHYLGPILDYRWEKFPDIMTDGSENLQGPIFVDSGTVAISIRALRDAYIKVSLGEDPTSSPTYWIILGGWKNTLSVLRSCPKGIPARRGDPAIEGCFHRKQQNEEANVLSSWQWKHFIISVTPEGEIVVNRTDGSQLLSWKDPQSVFPRQGSNTSFYLNFRTQDVVGHWKVHATSHSLIMANTSNGELIRLFSPQFKINQSTFCMTLMHFMSTRKNIPGMGLMIEKKAYVNMIAQQIGKDKGWTLIKYTGKVLKDYFGKSANFVISVNRNHSPPIAIQDLRVCPKTGIQRTAQLRIHRNEMRANESFVCLPLPNSKGMFIQCPPVKIGTINGVCVSLKNQSKSSCQCKNLSEICFPPCNATKDESIVSKSCQPDPNTCSTSPNGFPVQHLQIDSAGNNSQGWLENEQSSHWGTTQSTPFWTLSTESEVTVIENEELTTVPPILIQNLKVTSRSYSWLKITWQSPEINKFPNCSAFNVTTWKTTSNKTDEIRQGRQKWEQTLEIGPQTMCPGEWEENFCGTIWDLESSQNYSISVRPHCTSNDSMDAYTVTVTSETLPVPWGPSHIYVTNRTETSITLVWKAKLPKINSIENTFSVFYRESQLHSKNHTWNVANILAPHGSKNFTYQIAGLSPATLYEFCIHLNEHEENSTETVEKKVLPGDTLFQENLMSACTYTRTLLKKPFIPERTISYKNCTWSNGHISLSLKLNFNYTEDGEQSKARAYLVCVTNFRSRSTFFDWHIQEELLKELGDREFHVAAEFDSNLYEEFDFTLGDGRSTGGAYGNFINIWLNSSDVSKMEVILVAVTEHHGERRYSWQKASYAQQCIHESLTAILASCGGVILFIVLGAIGWIIMWKYHNARKVIGSCLPKINALCCQRNDVDSEWKGVKKREKNSIHLEPIPIEPDDQLEYSSDSGHEISLT